MILEKQKQAMILSDGETRESTSMSLDLDSAQILMQMLSKNLYSDAIGSSVRECVSNALDSHRRAGTEDPIIVSFIRNNDNNFEFCVEDFGIGLSNDDVEQIISKYGKSTKRDSTTELGMMGLGFKAPLAYTSSFYFICRKDGVERKYMMYEGEEENKIDHLYEAPTKERNGVKVIIPVKWGDRSAFVPKMKEQLAYFENVYFNVDGYYESIPNEFEILRTEHFQKSQISSDKNMHLCLDNVYYPLDFDKLGIARLEIPIGLRFSLTDGIFPTPNRESIRYTQEAKLTILDKINKVSDYFMNKYNETIDDCDDPVAIIQHYKLQKRKYTLNGEILDITDLLAYSKIPIKAPNLKGVKLIDLEKLSKHSEYMFDEYQIKFTMYNNRMSAVTGGYWNTKVSISHLEAYLHYIYNDVFSGNKKTYLKEIWGSNKQIKFIKKYKEFSLFAKRGDREINNFEQLLDLKSFNKSKWRDVIKEFRFIQKLILDKHVKDLDTLIIPQKWLDDRKKKRIVLVGGKVVRRDKLKGDISCKEAVQLERYVEGNNCKFVPKVHNLEKFHQNPHLTIYDLHENKQCLDVMFEIGKKQKLQYFTVSNREKNNLEEAELHNLITYEEFMKGDNKPFKRLVTAKLIYDLMSTYRNTFDGRYHLKGISTSLQNKLEELSDYRQKHHEHASTNWYDAALSIAEDKKLYDFEIYHVYLDVKSLLERLSFINSVMGTLGRQGGEHTQHMLNVLRDVLKYYKMRLDYTNYNIKLDDDESSKEVLTDEILEEISN